MTTPLRLRRDLPARLLADVDGTTVGLFYTAGSLSRWKLSTSASRQLLADLPADVHVWLEYADGETVPAVLTRFEHYSAISTVDDGLSTLQVWWRDTADRLQNPWHGAYGVDVSQRERTQQ